MYRQEAESFHSGASQEFEEDELKILLFNLCREVKAIFYAFARAPFVTGSEEEKDPELDVLEQMADDISKCDLVALSKDQPQNAEVSKSQDESFGCLTVFHAEPCEHCHKSNNSGLSKATDEVPVVKHSGEFLPPKIAKIELNSFLMRKLREKLASDEKKDGDELLLIKNLALLKEKFDRIVSHISDFSFVADTIKKQEHFKLYTQKVFL